MIVPANIRQYFTNSAQLPFVKRVQIYNEMTDILRDMIGLNHPSLAVKLVAPDKIISNDYNPNRMAKPETRLLELSMEKDGVTLPIVASRNDRREYVIVDGFHRTQVIKYYPPVCESLQGYVPVVELNKSIDDRIASTVRHNMARGSHKVALTAKLIGLLKKHMWSDKKIGKELGMEADEVLRMKQLTGLTEAFADREFSQSWE